MRRPRTASSLLAVLALCALLAAPGVAAACEPAVVTLETERLFLAPGADRSIRLAVENRNPAPARAVVEVEPPAGWSADLANPAPLLGAESDALTTLTVAAPERGAGVARGEIRLVVRLACEGGVEAATSESALPVAMTPLSPAIVGWVAAAGVLALGALAATRLVARVAGVGLAAPEPERTLPPGGAASFRIVVENRRTRAERVTLAVGPLPAGWAATLAAHEVALEPREEKEVWVALRAPPEAAAGARAEAVVHAALKDEPRRAAAVAVRAVVASP